jgi:hypothetical protein
MGFPSCIFCVNTGCLSEKVINGLPVLDNPIFLQCNHGLCARCLCNLSSCPECDSEIDHDGTCIVVSFTLLTCLVTLDVHKCELMKQVCDWFAANSNGLDKLDNNNKGEVLHAAPLERYNTPRPTKFYFGFSPSSPVYSPVYSPQLSLTTKSPSLSSIDASRLSPSFADTPTVPPLRLASSSPSSVPGSEQTSPKSPTGSKKVKGSFLQSVRRKWSGGNSEDPVLVPHIKEGLPSVKEVKESKEAKRIRKLPQGESAGTSLTLLEFLASSTPDASDKKKKHRSLTTSNTERDLIKHIFGRQSVSSGGDTSPEIPPISLDTASSEIASDEMTSNEIASKEITSSSGSNNEGSPPEEGVSPSSPPVSARQHRKSASFAAYSSGSEESPSAFTEFKRLTPLLNLRIFSSKRDVINAETSIPKSPSEPEDLNKVQKQEANLMHSLSIDYICSTWGNKKHRQPFWHTSLENGALLNTLEGWNLELGSDKQSSFGLEDLYVGRRWYKEFFYNKDHHVCVGGTMDDPYFVAIENVRKKSIQKALVVSKDGYRREWVFGSSLEQWIQSLQDTLKLKKRSFTEVKRPGIKSDFVAFEERCENRNFKFGLLFAKYGQSTEAEIFGNPTHDSPDFEEFANCLATKIELRGWKEYHYNLNDDDFL